MRLNLNDPFILLGVYMVAFGALLIGVMVALLVRKFRVEGRASKTNFRREQYRAVISRIVKGESFALLANLDKHGLIDVRNIISDMTPALKGQAYERVRQLYTYLKLDESDFRRLSHIDPDRRLRALNRLEKLKLPPPLDIHMKLLDDDNEVIRLLAMLLLIHTQGKRATPSLISFIEQKKFGKKGYLHYIIQEIGKLDKEALPFLFSRVTDADTLEAILTSAHMSPPPRFDNVIYRQLTKSSHPFVIVWALRVLMHYPSMRLFALVNILKDHPFWAVRLEVVRSLHLFDPRTVVGFVEQFTKDDNYLVRLAAMEFAMKDVELNKAVLNRIILEESHPSKSILNSLLATDELKAA